MYGPQSKAGQKADPRPVGSKQYMARCIRALITYLAQGSFDLSLSPDALQSPTGKLFQHIVYFIFRKIDPNVTLQGKIDEEFTMVRCSLTLLRVVSLSHLIRAVLSLLHVALSLSLLHVVSLSSALFSVPASL